MNVLSTNLDKERYTPSYAATKRVSDDDYLDMDICRRKHDARNDMAVRARTQKAPRARVLGRPGVTGCWARSS